MKSIVIIGASSGIGRQLAHQLADAGNLVTATYNSNKVQSNIDSISYHYCNPTENSVDFTFLPDRIDGLVYCPGSIKLRPFNRIKPEDFEEDFRLQVVGAVKVIQAALPNMKNTELASIVMFSTVAVQMGFNFHSLVSASKGAVEGLTRSLAAEFAPRIRVNCIAPSLTDTPMAASLLNSPEKMESNAQRHPLKKIGQPEDIANMVEFLLSDKSKWITGQVFHVDGGMSALKL